MFHVHLFIYMAMCVHCTHCICTSTQCTVSPCTSGVPCDKQDSFQFLELVTTNHRLGFHHLESFKNISLLVSFSPLESYQMMRDIAFVWHECLLFLIVCSQQAASHSTKQVSNAVILWLTLLVAHLSALQSVKRSAIGTSCSKKSCILRSSLSWGKVQSSFPGLLHTRPRQVDQRLGTTPSRNPVLARPVRARKHKVLWCHSVEYPSPSAPPHPHPVSV